MSRTAIKVVQLALPRQTLFQSIPKRPVQFNSALINSSPICVHGIATMSGSTPDLKPTAAPPEGKFEWIVILPDREGALERRVKVRPDHFKGITSGFEEGFWKMGGAFLGSVPENSTSQLDFKGSVMVAVASSKEEVVERLKQDIYSKEEVWNWDKVQIYPFKCAYRLP